MDFKKRIDDIINSTEANIGLAVKNITTQDIIFINEEKIFPSASLIKLFIFAEACRQMKEGRIGLNQKITLTDDDKVNGAGILKELNSGHKFAIGELLTLMTIISDNTATNIIIDTLGMGNINATINNLGFSSTMLQRKMMDFKAAKEGKENITSAKDILKILDLLVKGTLIDRESSQLIIDALKKQQVKGRLDLYLPEDVVIAHKTGDLYCLEHDVGIVYLQDNPYIICVLTNENISNKEGRKIIGKLSKIVYEEFSRQ
jgi:beta-lactamase class A